ncbi:HAMP domain-containing sensor histidine kinase [Streptomyces sp. SP18CS02]|uniref:HAMP domain-containing sensor histidine kinase n=1 Tax=Streptomyces sp. SP18CS02 TaxID=3002531 RepID=UPI002E789041|nr:HAMP domain-containing sensor histidine kinase [Streptomyces sp. SP18CS02]MEE1754455.1 HAMP domain-containing sensor histidine kinase [Streptomyces sp. SP18CS02]
MGLPLKAALLVAGTAAAIAALFALLVHQRVQAHQIESAAEAADRKLVGAVEDYASGVDGGALIDPPDLPSELRSTVLAKPVRATFLQASGAGGPVMWAAARSDETILAVKTSFAPQERSLNDLDYVLLGSGAVVTALGSLVGIVTAVATGRRITASARVARRIADGDTHARVKAGGKDEIGQLGNAINTMADALGARLEAERRVTADIAHELRTPVAGLVTAVGLLPAGRPTELVHAGVTTLRRLVEDVLEVARLDVPGVEQATREPVSLGQLAGRASALAGGTTEVLVRVDEVVETDPRRVERILVNLVANAHRHGEPPVRMEVDGTVIRVSDHGPGFPEEVLAHGPRRFQTTARRRGVGIGLGLTIALGQARVLGADVSFDNLPAGGARATLDLVPDRPVSDH